jgi:hypothetical protein
MTWAGPALTQNDAGVLGGTVEDDALMVTGDMVSELPGPVATPPETKTDQSDALVELQVEFQEMKRHFIDLAFGFQILETRNAELTARVQEEVPIGLPPELRDVISRVELLEAALAVSQGTEDAGRLDDILARLAALEVGGSAVGEPGLAALTYRLDDLESHFDNLERSVATLTERASDPEQIAAPEPITDLELEPVMPDNAAPYMAEMNDDGTLISVVKRNLSPADYALPASAGCVVVGAWFDETHSLTDYRAFFTLNGDTIRVCKQTAGGWRELVASNNERAHIVTEMN